MGKKSIHYERSITVSTIKISMRQKSIHYEVSITVLNIRIEICKKKNKVKWV